MQTEKLDAFAMAKEAIAHICHTVFFYKAATSGALSAEGGRAGRNNKVLAMMYGTDRYEATPDFQKNQVHLRLLYRGKEEAALEEVLVYHEDQWVKV